MHVLATVVGLSATPAMTSWFMTVRYERGSEHSGNHRMFDHFRQQGDGLYSDPRAVLEGQQKELEGQQQYAPDDHAARPG